MRQPAGINKREALNMWETKQPAGVSKCEARVMYAMASAFVNMLALADLNFASTLNAPINSAAGIAGNP